MKFKIDIFRIKDKERNEIAKNKGSNYFQKEFAYRKEEKTTSIVFMPINSNIDLKILDKKEGKKDIKKLMDNFNKVEGKKEEEKQGNFSLFEQGSSISTTCCSKNSELSNNSYYELKKKIKPKIYININSIKYEDEQKINEEIKKINDPYLNVYQKRKKVLQSNTTLTQDLRITKFHINIEKINKENENILNEKMNSSDMIYLNNFEKREKIIKDCKTTTNLKGINQEIYDNSNNNYYLLNNFNSSSQDQSTNWDTNPDISQNNNSSYQEPEKKVVKTFNSAKQGYYIKNKLYDLPLYEEKNKEKNKLIPEIYRIDENNYGFLYFNDIITNFITKSAFISEKKVFTELSEKDIGNCNYYENLGLYFCGKEVILENEKVTKRCCPNEFLCKNCMGINKKRYNIKNNYLINIKGRVAKINKGSYHCFGHFLCGIQIEDCVSKFSCEACKMLDLYSSYYQ